MEMKVAGLAALRQARRGFQYPQVGSMEMKVRQALLAGAAGTGVSVP